MAPDTVKAARHSADSERANPWDSPESPDERKSTSPLSSPTIRPQRRLPTPEPEPELTEKHHEDGHEAQEPVEVESQEAHGSEARREADTEPEEAASASETENAEPEAEAGHISAPDEAGAGVAASAHTPSTGASPRPAPMSPAHTPSHTDTSLGSSTYSWATPRTDASGRSGKSPPSPAQWPGMYEFSYLSEKEALEEADTGALVPFAAQELSSRLFSIESLGEIDTRELLDMIVALDRTHTERTIFLQHRLARSHR